MTRARQAISVLCLSIPILAAPPIVSADVVSAPGAFSYTAPPGWVVKTFPGMKYKICYARPVAAFAPNVVVVDEAAPGSLAQYVQLSLAQLKARYPGFHFLGQTSFTTRSGVRGVKLLAEASPGGRRLRQAFYLFAGRGPQKWAVTASTPTSEGAKYDPALDASLKTFTLK